MDNSFINRMAAGWEPKTKQNKKTIKSHENDWNWFFKDSDKDGVINGIDCKPYNKRKQDAPFLMSATSSFKPISSSGMITSGPNQNVSMAPPKSSSPPSLQFSYLPTTNKFDTFNVSSTTQPQMSSAPKTTTYTTSSSKTQTTIIPKAPITSPAQPQLPKSPISQPTQNKSISFSAPSKLSTATTTTIKNIISQSLPTPTIPKMLTGEKILPTIKTPNELNKILENAPLVPKDIHGNNIYNKTSVYGQDYQGNTRDFKTVDNWKEYLKTTKEAGIPLIPKSTVDRVLEKSSIVPKDISGNNIYYKTSVYGQDYQGNMRDFKTVDNWKEYLQVAKGAGIPLMPKQSQERVTTQQIQTGVGLVEPKQTSLYIQSSTQNKLSPETLNTMRNIISQSPPMATSSFPTVNAKNFKLPTDTHSSSLPDLRTNEEKIQASRQALASQLEASAIAGSVLFGPLILPALGVAATPAAVGTIGMVTGEGIGALHSVAQEGKVDVKDIAKNVAIGGVVGGVTGYGATKLFSNPGMIKIADYGPSGKAAETIYKLPGGAYVNRAVTNVKAEIGQVFPKPTVQSVTNKLGNTLYSIGSTKLTPAETAVMQKELSRRLAQDVAQPTVQSVTNKLGTTFSQIAGTKLTPAETVVMQNELAQRLAKDVGTKVATAAGFGIGGMMLNNPLSLGSKIKSLEIPTQTQSVLTRETAVGKAMAQTVTGSSGKGIDKMTPEERKSLIPIPTKVVNKEKIDSGRTLASTDYSTTDKQFPKAANITKIEYSNNGVPFNKDLWIQEGKYISPEGKEYTSNYVNYYDNVGQHIGYEVKLYPADLSSKKFNLYDSGLNRDNIEALGRVERAGYINNRNINVDSAGNRTNAAKDLTVQKSTEYLKNTGFKTEYVKEIPIFGVKETAGGIMDPLTKTVSIAETSQDKNATLIHETSHAQDFSNPIKGITDTLGITPGFKSGMTAYKEGKLSDVDSPIYSWIPPQLRGTEAKAHYIDEYYKGNLPRNDMVDAFEKQLGILNTSNTATGIDVIKAGNLYAEVAQQATK